MGKKVKKDEKPPPDDVVSHFQKQSSHSHVNAFCLHFIEIDKFTVQYDFTTSSTNFTSHSK